MFPTHSSLFQLRTDAQWRVMEGDGDRVIGERQCYAFVLWRMGGGMERAGKAKLGHYIIDCRVSGKDYEGSTRDQHRRISSAAFSVVVEGEA